MAKLSKAEAKVHGEAMALLAKDQLSGHEIDLVFATYHEAATSLNTIAGAFFTPPPLADELAYEVPTAHGRSTHIIDLCAGIGALAYATYWTHRARGVAATIVCVEQNPQYVEVGRKLLPEATWICGDVFEVLRRPDLGRFDVAISNPPFGRIKSTHAGRYTGAQFEFDLVEAASAVANYGVFILPQGSAPMRVSGSPRNEWQRGGKHDAWAAQTGLRLAPTAIDTAYARDQWKGVAPQVEIVTCDFAELRADAAPAVERAA